MDIRNRRTLSEQVNITPMAELLAESGLGLAHAHAIRKIFHVRGNKQALAFFDTIMKGTPLGDELKDESVQTAGTSQFVYDRVGYIGRKSTTMSMKMQIHVTEYDGDEPRVFAFDAYEFDAVSAHAAYAGYYADIVRFQDAKKKYIECLQHMQDEQGWLRATTDRAAVWVPRRIRGIGRAMAEFVYLASFEFRPLPSTVFNVENAKAQLNDLEGVLTGLAFGMAPLVAPVDDRDVMEQEVADAQDRAQALGGELDSVWTRTGIIPSGLFNFEQTMTRVLPQIVQPQRGVLSQFKVPSRTSLPDIYATPKPVENGRVLRWLTTGAVVAIGGAIVNEWMTEGAIALGLTNVAMAGIPMAVVGIVMGVVSVAVNLISLANSIGRRVQERRRLPSVNATKRGSAYWQTVQNARGTPVLTSLSAARRALIGIRQQERERKQQVRAFGRTNALYHSASGRRFQMTEVYHAKTQQFPSGIGAYKTNGDAEWHRAPLTSAMTMLPPVAVSDALHDAEGLRRIRLTEAIQRTVGDASQAMLVPAEMAARLAFDEQFQLIAESRYQLKGQHLIAPVPRMARQLAEAGGALLLAAFGTKAGVTLVRGDDPMWSCMQAGTAARMAVRHLDIFNEADATRMRLGDGSEIVDADAKHWSLARREMVDAFVREWVKIARDTERQSYQGPNKTPRLLAVSLADTPARLTEALRSFSRVAALASEGSWAFSLLALKHGHLCEMVRKRGDGGALTNHIPSFDYQRDLNYENVKRNAVRDFMHEDALWASRRIDAAPMRTWAVGDGEKNLVDSMAGLDIDSVPDGPHGATVHYYCPVGSHPLHTPGTVPFVVETIDRGLLWIGALADSAERLRRSLRPTEIAASDAGLVVGRYEEVARDPKMTPIGLARHPLVVALSKRGVSAHFVSDSAKVVNSDAVRPSTLTQAISILSSQSDSFQAVQALAIRARIAAFNTDRYLNAISLASTQTRFGGSMRVVADDEARLMGVLFALAVMAVEGPGMPADLVVHVKDEAEAGAFISRVHGACRKAIAGGCRAVTIAEACVSVA